MSSLETSVTLDDVFTVVEAKRVPLAPELAGYLTLEIADGTDAGSGDVDPKTVFISEEGTVALVRPKKDVVTGDVEASVRALLAKLLDASGSGTPALTTAAKRKPGNGLPALVEELEAALIPVNRAAGRRALARLAREVKRVLLGVGRNASVPPVVQRSGAPPAEGGSAAPKPPHARPVLRKKEDRESERDVKAVKPAAPAPPPLPAAPAAPPPLPNADVSASLDKVQGEVQVSRRSVFDDEAATAKRTNQLSELASNMNAVDSGPGADKPAVPPPPDGDKPLSVPPPPLPNRGKGGSNPPPPLSSPPKPLGSSLESRVDASLFGGDEVDSLLDSFGVSGKHEDKQMARELKAIAGMSPTPPPPDAKTLAELTKDVGKDLPKKLESSADSFPPIALPGVGGSGASGKGGGFEGDSVEALLAMTDPSGPAPAVDRKDASAAPPALPPLPVPPPIKSVEPALAPPNPFGAKPAANLPPSPLFGGGGGSGGGGALAAGAPASLRGYGKEDSPRAPDPIASSRTSEPKAPAAPPAARSAASSGQRPKASAPKAETGASEAQMPTKRTRTKGDRPRAPRTGLAMLIFALLVLGGGTAAVWKFAPQVFTGKKKPLPTATVSQAPVLPVPKCKVALVLTEVPANAEILLRMGQAPVDVERMPVGTRLELVATAEGYAPRRAVIKAESPWDKGPDGKPRIEVPIQLDPSKAKPGALDPWPAAEPGSQVGGSGAPGTVHVVSNVRGAEVWLLAGLGPEARIDQLRCDADIDVLFAGPPTLRKRLHLSEKDIGATPSDAAGNKVVNVSAKDGGPKPIPSL